MGVTGRVEGIIVHPYSAILAYKALCPPRHGLPETYSLNGLFTIRSEGLIHCVTPVMAQMSMHPEDWAVSTMYGLKLLTYSALVFHIWEWLIALPFEVEHIWKRPPSSTVKWQYLGSRYVGIAGQISNTIATGYIHSSYVVPPLFCLAWYTLQMLVGQVLLFSLELSLIRRLYALSEKNTRLKLALYTLVFMENIIVAVMAWLAVTFRQVKLTGACLLHKPPTEIAIIGAVVCITQFILWGLTLQHSWKKKMALTSLVMRDGSWVFGVLSIVIIGGTTHAFAPKHYPVFNPFSAFIASTVSSNCHIIMNLQRMQRRKVTSVTQFTSFIDTNISLDTLGPPPSTGTEESADCDNSTTEAR